MKIISTLLTAICLLSAMSCEEQIKETPLEVKKVKKSSPFIANDALLALRINSLNSVKGLLAEQFKGQFAMLEGMAAAYDKDKEAFVVMTSVMPPMVYVAAPLAAGKKLEDAAFTLPVNIKSNVKQQGEYLLIPLTGPLPTAFGKSKLGFDKEQAVHLSVDLVAINEKHGAFIENLLKQDYSKKMMGTQPQANEPMVKAMLKMYQDFALQTFKAASLIDVKVRRDQQVHIDSFILYKKDSTWAKVCKSMESYKLPESSFDKGSINYSMCMDYGKLKPIIEPMMEDINKLYEQMGVKDSSELLKEGMDAFYQAGLIQFAGSMDIDMAQKKMSQKVVMNAENNQVIKGVFSKWMLKVSEMFKVPGMNISYKKADFQIDGADVYSYVVKMPKKGLSGDMISYFVATDKGLFNSSDKEQLQKLSQIKLKAGETSGIMKMSLDYTKLLKGVPMPIALPKVDILVKTKGNGAAFNVSF
ncbi:MAG: hypothetical protein HRT88_02430 [Lentisphaeraceae bacterium]|nr:hypothetical protein [Lentisphaeraceae bacterium]